MAAFCTAWFDDVSRTGYLEPVATVAAHRSARAGPGVSLEALQPAAADGLPRGVVSGYPEDVNRLYRSIMGPDHGRSRRRGSWCG